MVSGSQLRYHLPAASQRVKSSFARLPAYSPCHPHPCPQGWSFSDRTGENCAVCETDHTPCWGPGAQGRQGPRPPPNGPKDRSSEHRNSGLTLAAFHSVVKTKHHFLFSQLGEIVLPLKEETSAERAYFLWHTHLCLALKKKNTQTETWVQ